MDRINNLILKYKLTGSYDYRFKKTLREIIKNKTKLELKEEDVSINDNSVYLKVNPKIKVLIKLKEKEIITELEKTFSQKKDGKISTKLV